MPNDNHYHITYISRDTHINNARVWHPPGRVMSGNVRWIYEDEHGTTGMQHEDNSSTDGNDNDGNRINDIDLARDLLMKINERTSIARAQRASRLTKYEIHDVLRKKRRTWVLEHL